AARRRDDDSKTEQKSADQEEPVLAVGDPRDDSSISGVFRKSFFKPTTSSNAGGGVIELRAEDIGRERNQRHRSDVKVAAACEESARDDHGLSLDENPCKQQQVTVFEE